MRERINVPAQVLEPQFNDVQIKGGNGRHSVAVARSDRLTNKFYVIITLKSVDNVSGG